MGKKIRQLTKVIAGCFCLMLLLVGSSSAKEWRGIVPLRSTRDDVRRILGQPLSMSSNFSDLYDVNEGRVSIMYIRQRCEQGLPADWGNWNVPPYTVVNIIISLKEWMPLSELGVPDIEKLKWYTDDAFFTYYHDKKEGVQYEVRDGIVRSITYGPTERDQHLSCRKNAPVIRY